MLESLWDAVHLLTHCTAQAFTQSLSYYYYYDGDAQDVSLPPPPPPPTMDGDVEMRDISDDIAQASKGDNWKKPSSRSSSRSSSKKRSVASAKPEKRVARTDAGGPPKVPSKKKSPSAPPPVPAPAAVTGGDTAMVAVNMPLKVKRRNADPSDADDINYYMVSQLNDATNYPYQVPRHVVVCAKDLPSAKGYIRNLLDKCGVGGNNQSAPDSVELVMDFASTTWIEPAGDETWFVGDDLSLSTDVDDTDAPLLLYGAYGFDAPRTMMERGCVASVVFVLAFNESHARTLVDKTLQNLGSSSPLYELAVLNRVAGAQVVFPPNLEL